MPDYLISPIPSSPRKTAWAALLLAAISLSHASETIVPPDQMTVAPGMEVTVWAQSPLLHNPTNMDIDRHGRIWVTQAVNYRHHRDRDPAGDKVVVMEDTDGDGQADTSHVFVQEPALIAPLGLAVIDNQIVVSCAPNIIVYTDVDRDLHFDPRVDRREVLLTGFDGINHDHSVHAVTVGSDGKWYFNAGNAGALFTDRSGRTFRMGSSYHPGNRFQEAVPGWRPPDYAGAPSDDGHVYVGGFAARMNPDGTQVEVIGHNFRNSYEQTVTSFGDVYQNDNDDPPASRTSFLLEYGNAGFSSADGKRQWQADRRPGQDIPTAHWRQEDPGAMPAGDVYGAGSPTGIAFYEGDLFGPQWRGLLLSGEAARNAVYGYLPTADGAGKMLERFNVLTSNPADKIAGVDTARDITTDRKTFFRPSDICVGPDGAIYVADWFDPRVGGHQDFDEDTVGAIYRLAPPGFTPHIPSFDLETVTGQLAALRNPAVHVRALGAERLAAAGDAVADDVAALLTDDNPFIVARAIALLARLGPAGRQQVRDLLQHSNPQFRIAALRALRRQNAGRDVELAALARDPSPAVRREVAVALRDIPFARSGPILIELATGYPGDDQTYLAAWAIGCTGKKSATFAAMEASTDPRLNQDSDHYFDLAFTLAPAAATPRFAQVAGDAAQPIAKRLRAMTALGFTATVDAADAMFALLNDPDERVRETAHWWTLSQMNLRWKDAGLQAKLKAAGIYDADTLTVVPSIVPVADPTQQLQAADVLALRGDPSSGKVKVAACRLCHVIDDTGIEYGPNLDGWTQRQGVEQLILATINPSQDIAHGYEAHRLILNGGTLVDGLVLAHGDPIKIKSMGGIEQIIPRARIARIQRLRRSVMLSADQLGLTPQDLADIAAYLASP